MSLSQILRPRSAAAAAIVLATVLTAALGARPASAQTYVSCPVGTYPASTTGPCISIYTSGYTSGYMNGYTNAYTTGYQYCNGSYIPNNFFCSPATGYSTTGYQYCNGSYLPSAYCSPATGYVTTSPSYTYCNGAYTPATSCYCYGSYVTTAYCPPTSPVLPGVSTASYAAGWNLVGVPTGTAPTGTSSPFYTLQPGASAYQTLPAGSTLQGGTGYWAYFSVPTTVSLTGTSTGTLSVPVAPGQWAMVGNPFNSTATVAGASVVLTFDAGSGYVQTNQLNPGQGAFVASSTGSVTITSGGSPFAPPPPPPFP